MDNTLIEIKELKHIISKVNERDKTRTESFESFLEEALVYLEKFINDPNSNRNNLQKAADNLLKSLKNKRNRSEPYICLGYIFYILSDIKISIKYLKVALLIDPESKQAKELLELVSSNKIKNTSTAISRLHDKDQELQNSSNVVPGKSVIKIASARRLGQK